MPESKEFVGRVISGNRITIPEWILDDLSIKKGEKVRILVQRARNTRGDTVI